MSTSAQVEPRPVSPVAILAASLGRLEELAARLDGAPELLAEVTARVAKILVAAGMRGADQAAGCAACGACSALSAAGG